MAKKTYSLVEASFLYANKKIQSMTEEIYLVLVESPCKETKCRKKRKYLPIHPGQICLNTAIHVAITLASGGTRSVIVISETGSRPLTLHLHLSYDPTTEDGFEAPYPLNIEGQPSLKTDPATPIDPH